MRLIDETYGGTVDAMRPSYETDSTVSRPLHITPPTEELCLRAKAETDGNPLCCARFPSVFACPEDFDSIRRPFISSPSRQKEDCPEATLFFTPLDFTVLNTGQSIQSDSVPSRNVSLQ